MRILTALTYYRPYYSGLTIYAERLARALVERGNQVTVLTSRYQRDLPADEKLDGVRVYRLPVLANVSKGVLMPAMFLQAWAHIRKADIVHLHLPQLDAAYLALICWLLNKPVVLTYHCDLVLPAGFVHSMANQVSHLANTVSMRFARQVVVNSMDYAESSSFLRRYLQKICAVVPPVEVAASTREDELSLKHKTGLAAGQRTIGMVARLAAEKGVEYLVEAMPDILKKHPNVCVLYVGQYQNVLGEEEYIRKLTPLIQALGGHWKFLGILPPGELKAFYRLCEVTVLPSTNSTESYGIVQVESMSCGTPVVASDMPGVRQPVRLTGMGRLVPPANAQALAEGIGEVLSHPDQYRGDVQAVIRRFSPQQIAQEYERIFQGSVKNQETIR
jgi:glycosyltransferase involved in cell wall biosynthesis